VPKQLRESKSVSFGETTDGRVRGLTAGNGGEAVQNGGRHAVRRLLEGVPEVIPWSAPDE
jgi:hypothetical protein